MEGLNMSKTLSPELLEALRNIDGPTLSNAIEELHVRDLMTGYTGSRVRCMFPELGVTVGYAVTVQVDSTSPGPPAIGSGLRQVFELVEASPKPVVLVFQDIGPRPGSAASFGELGATMTKRLGAVALVTDGAVRDVNEARALGFQFFAAGSTVSHGNPRFVRAGVPVVVDGLYLEPGELLHGDVNGVVSVPLDIADQLPAQVERIRDLERGVLEFVKEPSFTLDAALKRMGL